MSYAPIPRSPRQPRQRQSDTRESVLRASILDTALELGVGSSNSTVANWIFNPVQEVDEDAEGLISPSLTYASTATSEESYSSISSHLYQPGAGILNNASSFGKFAPPGLSPLQYSQTDGLSSGRLTPDPSQRAIQFDISPTPEPRPISPKPPTPKAKKLRKARPDGYESDGGYVGDGSKGGKKDKKDKKSKMKKEFADGNATEYESDGDYLSESASKKKKDKKSKMDKTKTSDVTATDYESDGGYMSSISFGRKKSKSKKSTVTSPTTGDESDGGYLSENSVKKRKFFRLHSKSKKKQDSADSPTHDVIPPVPSLPPMTLRIAEMYSRSTTPNSFDASRTVTPALSERTVMERPSYDTFHSSKESMSSELGSPRGLTNAFKDAESVRSPSIDVLAAFGRRATDHAHSASPLQPKSHTLRTETSMSSITSGESASSRPAMPTQMSSVPSISLPKAKKNLSMKRTPLQISAPNTQSLTAKHTPVPLILTPPTPINALSPDRPSTQHSGSSVPSPTGAQFPTPALPRLTSPFDPLSVLNRTADVPRTPSPHSSIIRPSSDYIVPSPLPSPGISSSAGPSQTLVRPRVLAYYDLPPPSPPPQGPLPSVPPVPVSAPAQLSRGLLGLGSRRSPVPPGTTNAASSRPGTADSMPESSPSPSTSSSPLYTNKTEPHPHSAPNTHHAPPSPFRSPLRTSPSISAPTPTSAPSSASTPTSTPMSAPSALMSPLFLQRIPSVQRGRESPFPAKPVLPREESADLVRRTSVVRMNGRNSASPSPSPSPSRRGGVGVGMGGGGMGINNRMPGAFNFNPPASADPYQIGGMGGLRQQQQRLDAHWQPRSASAMDIRRRASQEVGVEVGVEDHRRSWLDYGDDDDVHDRRFPTDVNNLKPDVKQDEVEVVQPGMSNNNKSIVESTQEPDMEAMLLLLRDHHPSSTISGSTHDREPEDNNSSSDIYYDNDNDAEEVRRQLQSEGELASSHQQQRRSTLYYDLDDSSDVDVDGGGGGDGDVASSRYSVWSDAVSSRVSILDGERSGNVRERFVKRVEAMYGKSKEKEKNGDRDREGGGGVPPVPKLSVQTSTSKSKSMRRNGMF